MSRKMSDLDILMILLKSQSHEKITKIPSEICSFFSEKRAQGDFSVDSPLPHT